MQLAAYAGAKTIGTNTEIWSAVLSTTNPGKVWFKKWGDRYAWWDAFHAAYIMWCTMNNYNPRTGEKWFQDE
jgi:hypothetical protein